MSGNDFELYKETFVHIKEDVNIIKTKLIEISQQFDSGNLLSETTVEGFKEKLSDYLTHKELLHSLGQRLLLRSITNLNEIPDVIREFEEKQKTEKLKETVFEYLLLDSTEEECLPVLENTKKSLIYKYEEDNFMFEKIKPYEMVITKTKLPDRTLTRSEHSIISREIDPDIAYAVEHNELFFNAELDVSTYCREKSIFKNYITKAMELTCSSTVDDSKIIDESKSTSEITVYNEEENQVLTKFFKDYSNYISPSSVIHADLTKGHANQKELQQLVNENEMIPYLLWTIAREQLCKKETFSSKSILIDAFESLKQKEYIVPLKICDGDECSEFYVLSNKGCECFTNPSVNEFWIKTENQFSIPETIELPVRLYSNLYIHRLSHICEYMQMMGERYVAWSMDETDVPIAIPLKYSHLIICSGAFSVGSEEADILSLSRMISALNDGKILLIIVKAHRDIVLLSENLLLKDIDSQKVYFAVSQSYYAIFDNNGMDIKSTFNEINGSSDLKEWVIKTDEQKDKSTAQSKKTDEKDDYVIADNRLITDTPKASHFKKVLQTTAKIYKNILSILPLFTNFGVLTIDQVYSFGVCMDVFSYSEEQQNFVTQSVEYLTQKGYLVKYRLSVSGEIKDVYCLSHYCCSCMRMESISSLKNFWHISLGKHLISGEEKMRVSLLQHTYTDNVFLLDYLMSIYRNLEKQDMRCVRGSIRWRNDHYQVSVIWKNVPVQCSLIPFAGKTNISVANNNVLIKKDDIEYVKNTADMIFYLEDYQICLFNK